MYKIGLDAQNGRAMKSLASIGHFLYLLMNDKGETMINKGRVINDHSPLLWTNTCISHQRDENSNIQAGKRG